MTKPSDSILKKILITILMIEEYFERKQEVTINGRTITNAMMSRQMEIDADKIPDGKAWLKRYKPITRYILADTEYWKERSAEPLMDCPSCGSYDVKTTGTIIMESIIQGDQKFMPYFQWQCCSCLEFWTANINNDNKTYSQLTKKEKESYLR